MPLCHGCLRPISDIDRNEIVAVKLTLGSRLMNLFTQDAAVREFGAAYPHIVGAFY